VTIRALTFGRFADDNFGGLERYVFQLAESLHGIVAYVNIVARRGGKPDIPMCGRTIYARPGVYVGGTPVCPTMPFHAMRLHWTVPFDLVHLQFPADPMAHLSLTLLPRKVRRVLTWHSDIVRQQKLLDFYEPFLKSLLRSADAIIVPTPAHYTSSQHLTRWASSERVHIVPFGLDYSRFTHRPQLAGEIRRRHAEAFLIFALGRHVYYKGFEYLVQAMSEIDAHLIIGGQGPLTESLKQQSYALGLQHRVEFAGRIPDADLPAYYHACDVFCMPSVATAEAFGLVQLEAMACGKPVVCCELRNGVNWVNLHGVTGLAVEPRSPQALTSALQRLKDDALLRTRLGTEAKKRALGQFSLEGMARATLAVYRRVLD
jgi:glycosyltransferase involved in cell wall biosynthesis